MKDVIRHIECDGINYPICFNLNVMEEIQELYGSVSAWGNIVEGNEEPKIKDLKNGLLAMMNEAIDIENDCGMHNPPMPFVESKKLGRILSEVGILKAVEAIKDVTIESVKVDGEPKNE